jgi:hypothetical protein
VHVPDRQKDADALARDARLILIRDNNHTSIRWGNDRVKVGRNDTLRIAEEIENKGRQKHQKNSRDNPVSQESRDTQSQRGHPEVVSLFDHAS